MTDAPKRRGRPPKKKRTAELHDIVNDARDRVWEKLPDIVVKLAEAAEGDRLAAIAIKDFLLADPRLNTALEPIKETIDDYRRSVATGLLAAGVGDRESEGGEELPAAGGDPEPVGSDWLSTLSLTSESDLPQGPSEAGHGWSPVGEVTLND